MTRHWQPRHAGAALDAHRFAPAVVVTGRQQAAARTAARVVTRRGQHRRGRGVGRGSSNVGAGAGLHEGGRGQDLLRLGEDGQLGGALGLRGLEVGGLWR